MIEFCRRRFAVADLEQPFAPEIGLQRNGAVAENNLQAC